MGGALAHVIYWLAIIDTDTEVDLIDIKRN